MTAAEYRHQKELFQVEPILKEIGVSRNECICDDRPDIILPDYDGKTIGIEVVCYGEGKNTKNLAALNKVLSEYQAKIDKESDKRYEIFVIKQDGEFPINRNFHRIKKKMFAEIDGLRNKTLDPFECEYIYSVSFLEVPNMIKSHVAPVHAFWYGNTDIDLLNRIIEKKNKKLAEYKKMNRPTPITEYWLDIFYPVDEETDFRKLSITEELSQNDFDRIYLTEIRDCKRIK
jgi:hypothetical protein